MSVATRPNFLSVDPGSIPRELTDDPAWYPALIEPSTKRVGKWDKIPADPTTAKPAKWSDPATRVSFAEAFMAYQQDPRFKGVGYMMHRSGIIGIDLDDSLTDEDAIKPWAREIVDQFPCYWERSVSGTGLRGFCKGTLEQGGIRNKIEGCSVEVYADERFLVVTGQALATVDELPDLQDAVDALVARLENGRERATGTAIVSGLAGRTESLSTEAYELVSDITGGRYGAQMLAIWTREDADAVDVSEQDWALACELTWHAVRRGYAGEDLARIVEETMRAGPYRTKWDERRGQTTWLAQDVANAIATVKKRLNPPTLELDAEDTAAADPSETPEQIIARLERDLAKSRAVQASQQTIIRAQRAMIEELKALRDEDRRLRLAERELDKVKGFSATQKTAIKVVAGIVTSAVSRDVAPQVITRGMVAEGMGCHEATAGAALKVCDLPGSPVRRMNVRTNELDEDGMARPKIVTQYYAETPCPADIIEGMIRVAEGLAGRHRRYEPKQCPKHPDADTYTQTRCGICHDLVAGEESPCERLAPMEPSPESVAVPLPITSDSLPWGDSPDGQANGANAPTNGANGHHSNGVATLTAPHRADANADLVEHDARAAGAMAAAVGAVREVPDSAFVATPSTPAPIQRPPAPLSWCCPCTAVNRVRRVAFDDWVCDGCGIAVPSPEERP